MKTFTSQDELQERIRKRKDQQEQPRQHEQERASTYNDNVASLPRFKKVRVSDVQPKAQEWLWEDHIPLRTCTLFAGIGGIGKSQLLLFIASIISTGKSFNAGGQTFSLPKGEVLILSAEDSLDSSIAPRLIAVGADTTKIQVIESIIDPSLKVKERFVSLDTDIELLSAELTNNPNIKLIIIDPITAYLGNIQEHKATEVRAFILKLNKLANDFGIAIILNTHLRKKSSGENAGSAADEVRGSGAWTGTVRQAFILARDHDDPKKTYFLNMKRNIGGELSGLAYQMKSHEFVSESGEQIKISYIEWESSKANVTADEAVDKKAYEERSKMEEAKALILDALRFSSKTFEQMRQLAIQNDINENTMRRARNMINTEGKYNIAFEPSPTDRRKMIWYIKN